MYKKIILLISLLFIASCATHTAIQVYKPAELNVGAVRKLAVLDFDFKGNWDFSADEKQTLAKAVIERIRKKKNRQQGLDPNNAYPGKNVSTRLVAKLVGNGYYTVIEREQLEKILQEQTLALSGMVDESQAAHIGQLLGVEALVMGSGSYSVKDEGKWVTITDKKKKEKQQYNISRNCTCELTYRIINVEKGTIMFSRNLTASNTRHAKGDNEEAAAKGLPDWKPMVDQLVDNILNRCVQQIAPHYVTENREIEEGDSDQMKAGVEYAKRSLWDDARQIWKEVASDPNSEKDDRIAALYDLGLYHEINGDLDKAEDFYDQCFKLSGKSKYLDRKANILKRKKEQQRLEQQMQED